MHVVSDGASSGDPVRAEPGALLASYDGIVCDLDGVVYRGGSAVPHAVESLTAAAQAAVRVVYATNNASRTPASVAEQLRDLGLHVDATAVVTSSQAGAERILAMAGVGAPVLAVGGPGVRAALEERGLNVLDPAGAALADRPVRAVLQGYGADVGWRDLAEAAYAVQRGAAWVATNDDATLPTERGVAPGNGTLVAAVRAAVQVEPVVVGKPHTPLYALSASVLGTSPGRTLAVGDRIDTDIAGANAAGMDALLVLTGVSSVSDLAYAEPARRPRYLGLDLRCLLLAYPEPGRRRHPGSRQATVWTCGDARVELRADGEITGLTTGSADNRLRAAMTAIWHAQDEQNRPGHRAPAPVPGAHGLAAAVVEVTAMVEAQTH